MLSEFLQNLRVGFFFTLDVTLSCSYVQSEMHMASDCDDVVPKHSVEDGRGVAQSLGRTRKLICCPLG